MLETIRRMNLDINYKKEKRTSLWSTTDGSGTVLSILYTFLVFQARQIQLFNTLNKKWYKKKGKRIYLIIYFSVFYLGLS